MGLFTPFQVKKVKLYPAPPDIADIVGGVSNIQQFYYIFYPPTSGEIELDLGDLGRLFVKNIPINIAENS